jgi:hypothetical protein
VRLAFYVWGPIMQVGIGVVPPATLRQTLPAN